MKFREAALESDPDRRSLAAKASLVGLALSIALMISGVLWSQLARPEHVWSEQQAKEFLEARNALHAASHSGKTHANHQDGHADHDHSSAGGGEAEFEQVQQRFNAVRQELEAARNAKNKGGSWLIRTGLVAAACFGIVYLVSRPQ